MIYLGSDHRGYELKERIKKWLTAWGIAWEDLGNKKYDPEDDYPIFAKKVGKRVGKCHPERSEGSQRFFAPLNGAKNGKDSYFGILICGSGIGMDIAANKLPGIRCGLGFCVEQIKRGREEDDINCLALPADFLEEEEVKEIVKVFLKTKFLGKEKYRRRIEKIAKINPTG